MVYCQLRSCLLVNFTEGEGERYHTGLAGQVLGPIRVLNGGRWVAKGSAASQKAAVKCFV